MRYNNGLVHTENLQLWLFYQHNAMHSLDYVYLLLKNVLSFFTSSSHFHMVVSPSVRGNTHTQQHIC